MSSRKGDLSSGLYCTKCDKELAHANEHAVTLKGQRPI